VVYYPGVGHFSTIPVIREMVTRDRPITLRTMAEELKVINGTIIEILHEA
jgi:hypothetical protein